MLPYTSSYVISCRHCAAYTPHNCVVLCLPGQLHRWIQYTIVAPQIVISRICHRCKYHERIQCYYHYQATIYTSA
jgi:hypothetical protein